MQIAQDKLVDSLVIGLDYIDGDVSKDSVTGVSSKQILDNILLLKDMGQDVSIACVYDGDINRLVQLVEWCIDNGVTLKILEVSDDAISKDISEPYIQMVNKVVEYFSLDVGEIQTFNEYYGVIDGEAVVYFFHSHCRLLECVVCGKIHLRVTADGYIKSCIQEDTGYPLLNDMFDDGLSRIVSNLGYSPESRIKFTV